MTVVPTFNLALVVIVPFLSAGIVLSWMWTKVLRRAHVLPPDPRRWVERRWVIRPAMGLTLFSGLCLGWAYFIEPFWVQVSRIEIKVARPILGHERFRILHLSDFHLEADRVDLRKLLGRIKDIGPHLIALTGDYVHSIEKVAEFQAFVKELKAEYGVFAVAGHWERKLDWRELFAGSEPTEAHPVARVLDDSFLLLKEKGAKLFVVGRALESHHRLSDLLVGKDPNAFCLILSHKPDVVSEIEALPHDRRVDLVLCGHTHGGQVRLPFLGSVIPQGARHTLGYHRVGVTHLYLNRGIGVEGGPVPRLRFFCRPEIAVIDCVAEDAKSGN